MNGSANLAKLCSIRCGESASLPQSTPDYAQGALTRVAGACPAGQREKRNHNGESFAECHLAVE
jgi:hypothetical protein